MSYQFEDDSALEELLNQQLDRRRQPPNASASSVARGASTRSASFQRGSLTQTINERPSTATASSLKKQTTFENPTDVSFKINEPAKGRLASWLETKSANMDHSEPDYTANVESRSVENSLDKSFTIEKHPKLNEKTAERDSLIEDRLTDDYLQEMSKQRLIQIILEQILPAIKNLRQSIDKESAIQIDKIKSQLESEKSKIESLKVEHQDQMKVVELRWIELNKRLELQLESTIRELNQTGERHRSSMSDLEAKHKEQVASLVNSYENRLTEERRQFEDSQKRRDEFHQLELESKLKVNWDQVKLDTIFREWQKMIQSTISDLDLQFKSVESLLDKQTIEINGSNTKLAERCKQVVEHYEKFESNGEQMNRLMGELGEILPRFSRIQTENEHLTQQVADQLCEFSARSADLQSKETDLNRLQSRLVDEREELNKEKFRLGLDTNKLVYKEERLDELLKNSKETEARLAEQSIQLASRESDLEIKRSNLEMRTGQLRLQNYELHLMRKKLIAKEEKLNKLENELEAKNGLISNQLAQVRSEMETLLKAREGAQKELGQLRRLQKSLICSLCLDRLFASDTQMNKSSKFILSATQTLESSRRYEKQSIAKADSLKIGEDALWNTNAPENQELTRPLAKDARKGVQDISDKFEDELTKIGRQIKRDERQLEAENRYIELLSVS